MTITNYVDIPNEFNINDFCILNDTLYCCGYTINDNLSTQGFIAYTHVKDMFNDGKLKWTPINLPYGDTLYNINKIKAYNDNTGERIVAGIGTMHYGKPESQFINMQDENVVDSYNKFAYDCFIIYKIKEQQVITNSLYASLPNVMPIYATANEVYLYHNPDDSSNSFIFDKFADITLTKDYICVASIENYQSVDNQYASPLVHNNRVVIRRFDKNNYNQVSNYTEVPTNILGYFPSVFRLEGLDSNNIALSYVLCACPMYQYTKNIVQKINIDNSIFSVIHTSIFDSANVKNFLRDIQYFKSTNQLLVLKQSLYDNANIQDYIYYLDMYNNTSFPYPAVKLDISPSFNAVCCWNSMLYYDSSYYVTVGTSVNRISLFYRDGSNKYNTDCDLLYSTNIDNINRIEVMQSTLLYPCYFSKRQYFSIDNAGGQSLFLFYGQTNIYDAIIDNIIIPKDITTINKVCKSKREY